MHHSRGSTWQIWDLHVHTPASGLAAFGDPTLDSTWNDYAARMLIAARAHGVTAICLADYFTLDGYVELLDRGIYDPVREKWHGGGESIDLVVLPGIELRLSQITGESNAINLHVIFDPTRLSASRLQSDFLANLHLDPQHGGQRLRATRDHLLALGKATTNGTVPNLNEPLSELSPQEQRALFDAAIGAASVTQQELVDVLKTLDRTVPGGRAYLLAIAASGHGGLHELPWEGHAGTIRQSLLREADLLFSSNQNDHDFLLGRLPSTPAEECVRRFGRLKPCVWGSDAKALENLLHPSDGNTLRYTWIKADQSFEGLKQLVYEPCDRVAVQEVNPEARPWNTVIDAVRFLDDTKGGIVSEEWIPLNPSLTAVIGGKSSGKSLLLHFIAKTIDPVQVRDRAGPGNAPYDLLEQDLSFQVRWKNGDVQTLGGAELAPSRITYLPQSYINQLAEPDSQDQLEDVIIHLLREDAEFSEAESALRTQVEQHRTVVTTQLQKLFELKRQISDLSHRVSELGSEAAVLSEIERLQNEQTEILKAAGMTEAEENHFAELRQRRSNAEESHRALNSQVSTLDETLSSMRVIRESISAEISDLSIPSGDTPNNAAPIEAVRTIVVQLVEDVSSAFLRATRSVEAERSRITAEIGAVSELVERITQDLEPYQAKLTGRERATALADAEKKQKELLGEIQEETQRRMRLQLRLAEGTERVIEAYRLTHNAFTEFIRTNLAEGDMAIAPDVRLISRTRFDSPAFITQFQAGLDGRQRIDGMSGLVSSVDGYTFPGIDEHCRNIKVLLADLVSPDGLRTLKLRKAYSPETMASALVRDHFGLHLSLQHSGDDLRRMSPGKRGMVLLRLLLEKSDATHPILIDQPEDNLDNRTVFAQLRRAVRDRKQVRQIIVVTHNANLVVSTDAECVLVAHQYGPEEIPPGLTRFEYLGGALEYSTPYVDLPSVVGCQGTREHVCEILEGGEQAFRERQEKYEFSPT